MTEGELRTAVRRHTTSKLRDASDLEAGIDTLGFRGEALHTIGAVSRTTITTKARGTDGAGTKLTLVGGEVESVESAGPPTGTAVEVTDLFYNTPAREKYLKREATEFDHVSRVVTRYALANPGVAFALEHDGREVFSTTGQGDLRATILAVYGREVARSMVAVEEVAEGPLEDVSGYVSDPETTRSSPTYVSTYVDGRYVRSGPLRKAIVDAYGTRIAPDRYPFAVLDLSAPPGEVDVNVHPRKLEVRYNKSEAVERQVRTTVENTLREEGILPSTAPRGRSAPDQAKIEPSSTSDDTGESTTGSTDEPATDDAAKAGIDNNDTTTAGDADVRPSPNTEPTRTTSSRSQSRSTDTTSRSTSSDSSSQSSVTPSSSSHTRPSRSTTPNESKTQTTLSGDDAHPTTEYDNFPNLRVLGQLRDTYIVAEADDGLLLIDQHAADERINYERLQERFEGDTTTQALAEPVRIELTSREAELFDPYKAALAQLGFHADRVDDRTVKVTTVPGLVAESAGPKVIRDVLADLVIGKETAEQTVEAVADELLSDMACYPSITGNTSLTDGSVIGLLSTLDDCENPWTCPHGRPVLIQIDSEEIENRFERDYPGRH
jgi:DNA mismatch repair protein MutL